MRIKSVLKFLSCVSCVSWFLSFPVLAGERPNFVFIIADDVSADDLGCFGNAAIETPNLDALAAEGMAFDRAYLTTSSCSPTRCSIITGRYPHNTGAPELHMPLPAGQFMFPQALREAGYYTELSGKNHMGLAVKSAFDKITHPTGMGGEARWIDRLRSRPRDKPFFMWLAAVDAHRDWQRNNADSLYDPANVVVPPYLVDGPVTRQDIADFYHEITRLDRFVGKVREELERQGVAENTYIIFTADNGRPFPRCKTRLYDSGTKTPLIVWRPGTIGPARTESLVSAIDIAPTVLELAGVAIDPRVQGVSFAPILADPTATTRDYAFAEHNWHVGQAHERSVRFGDWLYIRNSRPDLQSLCVESGPSVSAGKELWDAQAAGRLSEHQQDVFLKRRPVEEFYNVKDDPHQLRNLAENPLVARVNESDTLAHLRQALDRWTEETGDSVQKTFTPAASVTGTRQGMSPDFKRGDMPGADRGAATLNAPGPIRESME